MKGAIDTLALLTQELESKNTSIDRLRKMIFGEKTEKTRQIFGEQATSDSDAEKKKPKEKQPGHGRHGAAAYTGATKVKVPHPSYSGGELCSSCQKGKMYRFCEPAPLVRITGMSPLGAKIYECEKYRCNLCGEVSTAPAPKGVGDAKYDETATSMIGLLKYGTGIPFNRIEKLQQGFGIPMPASTQWELVEAGAKLLKPVHEELMDQAAQGKVLYNDDTTMKILKLSKEQRAAAQADNAKEERTGTFTSGIVSTLEKNQIALFFTGVKHAGENLSDVLKRRCEEMGPPIQMCDALSRNTKGDFKTILSNCNAHARRKYVDVAKAFPEECHHVLDELGKVYENDATARLQNLSDHR